LGTAIRTRVGADPESADQPLFKDLSPRSDNTIVFALGYRGALGHGVFSCSAMVNREGGAANCGQGFSPERLAAEYYAEMKEITAFREAD
jgi:hypothetical protein